MVYQLHRYISELRLVQVICDWVGGGGGRITYKHLVNARRLPLNDRVIWTCACTLICVLLYLCSTNMHHNPSTDCETSVLIIIIKPVLLGCNVNTVNVNTVNTVKTDKTFLAKPAGLFFVLLCTQTHY